MVFTVADDSFTAVSVTVTVSFIHSIQNRQIKFGRDSCSRSSRSVTDAGALSLWWNHQIRKAFRLYGTVLVLISDIVDLPCLLQMAQWREESPCPFSA